MMDDQAVPALIPPDFERLLNQLAALVTIQPSSLDVSALHRGLVLQALEDLPSAKNPEEVAAHIQAKMHIAIPIDQVVRSVGALVEQGLLQTNAEHRVSLHSHTRARLKLQGEKAENLKQKVLAEWFEHLDAKCIADGQPELTALERIYLAEDLQLFLLQLVRYQGAEIATFLYPEHAESREVLEVDLPALYRELEQRDESLDRLRRKVLPAFVREAKGERAVYVAELLRRAMLLQVLQADSNATALFMEVSVPKVVYLDTNVVFRILGLQGDVLRIAARQFLSLGQSVNYTFVISTRTYNELENLVRRQADWLEHGREVPQALAEVAAEFVAGNDYVSAYWRDRQLKGITAGQFRKTYLQLKLQLENLSIGVTNDLVSDVTNSTDLNEMRLALKEIKPFDDERLIEHDALHKVLIERLRLRRDGLEPEGWYEVTHVFATFDNRLPVFALRMAARHKGQKIPFCVMANELLELLCFMRPGESIPADTLVALVNSPYLQTYFAEGAVNRDIVREVVATMGDLGEYRPAVARKVLVNRALTMRLEAMQGARTRREVIVDAVRTEAAAVDRGLQSVLDKKERELAETRRELEEVRSSGPHPTAVQQSRDKPSPRHRRQLEELRNAVDKQGKDIVALRSELAAAEELRTQFADLQKTVQILRTQTWTSLLVAVIPIAYGAGLLLSNVRSVLGWSLAISGIAMAVVRRFRGRMWELGYRIAAVVSIILAIWDHWSGLRSLVVRSIHRLQAGP